MRFEIGQEVWVASLESESDWVTCPDCGGMRYIRCLLYDDTMVTVDCQACQRGYEGSQGRLQVYTRKPRATQTVITGVEINGEKAEWRTPPYYIVHDDDVFLTEAEAADRAAKKAAQMDADERDRIAKKEKDTRSWSWNVHYHRREIRDAQKRIEYHTSKLAVARVKAKEPEAS